MAAGARVFVVARHLRCVEVLDHPEPARIARVEPVVVMEAPVPPAAEGSAPGGVPVVVPEVVMGVGMEPGREQDVPGARHLERRDSPELVLETVFEVSRPRRGAGE
jgi:hypothetical protein